MKSLEEELKNTKLTIIDLTRKVTALTDEKENLHKRYQSSKDIETVLTS
jgi:hypothetical protein